jgi:hypothetical protein
MNFNFDQACITVIDQSISFKNNEIRRLVVIVMCYTRTTTLINLFRDFLCTYVLRTIHSMDISYLCQI